MELWKTFLSTSLDEIMLKFTTIISVIVTVAIKFKINFFFRFYQSTQRGLQLEFLTLEKEKMEFKHLWRKHSPQQFAEKKLFIIIFNLFLNSILFAIYWWASIPGLYRSLILSKDHTYKIQGWWLYCFAFSPFKLNRKSCLLF